MEVLESATLDIDKLDERTSYWAYNGLDCCITFEVLNALLPKEAEAGFAYKMSRKMQGPAFTMMKRGIKIDGKRREELIATFSARKARFEAFFLRLTSEVFDIPKTFDKKKGKWIALNYASPDQLKDLFYSYLGLPEVKSYNKLTREYSATTNREALEKLRGHPSAKIFCDLILAMRDIDKKLNLLTLGLRSGRMHCSYQVAGTLTGRWSSNEDPFGSGCVPGDTQVLTDEGWVDIADYVDGTPVAQWQSDGTIYFHPAQLYKTKAPSAILQFSSEQIHQRLTFSHTVPQYNNNLDKFTKKTALETSQLSSFGVPVAGKKVFGNITYPKLIVALMADGSFEGSGWRIAFKKQRKIDRFLALVKEAGLSYSEQSAKPGYRRFYISKSEIDCPLNWGKWVLNCRNLYELVQEARYWDATERGNSFWFFSAKEKVAEWFAIACHIVGCGTTTRIEQQNEGSYSTTPIYQVNVKPRMHVKGQKSHWKQIPFNAENVYCLTTQTGMFLIRDKGFISVTGNTNLQNISDEMRRIFVPDKGKKFAQLDLAQAESRLVAHLALPFGKNYLEACNSGDLHTTVTKLIWKDLDWTSAPAKEIAKRKFYRDFSYRDMAKRGGHATNYGASSSTVAMHLKIPAEQARIFQNGYLGAFSELNKWHNSVKMRLVNGRTITTSLGRRCQFLGRPWDNETIKSAIAYEPQSTIGDLLNEGLYRVWKQFDLCWGTSGRLELVSQVHDSILFQYAPEDESSLLPLVRDTLQVVIPINGEDCKIGVDIQVGWNWSKHSPANPFGLKDWNGSDDRTAPAETSLLDRRLYPSN
jgi:DNA polymerase I-like protein with 3'-5' exonuclease and polymerase domains